jgi:oligoribonuclease NrnB/cAMP/cGMP phosphodiesterase (DHH superfamily)
MTKNLIIAYHANCNDGQIAAFVAWSFTGRKAQTVSVNYDLHKKSFQDIVRHLTKNLPADNDLTTYQLLVVDFSFPYDVLKQLAVVFGKVVVIDHHKTAQDDLNEHLKPTETFITLNDVQKSVYQITPNVRVVFCMDESGALMTWRYYAGEGASLPDFVRYTSDRDLWKFLDPRTRPFTSGMGLHRSDSWEQLEKVLQNPEQVITDGRIIESTRSERVKSILNKPARLMRAQVEDTQFEIGCYNAPADITSDLLSEYVNHPDNYPIGMTYTIGSDDVVYCSLRSRVGVDCSVIAKVLGGGGHSNACGFIVPLKHFVEMLETQDLT